MADINPEAAFTTLKDNVSKSIGAYFPFEGRFQRLVLDKVWVDDNLKSDDIKDQAEARFNEKTWGVKVKGQFSLIDKKTGKVLDKSTISLATIPKLTNRYGYIVAGNEYQVDHLFRLKSGVYARVQDNGELESEFNLVKGPSGNRFSVHFNPSKKHFSITQGDSKIPLYPVLKAMGVDDDSLEHSWGKDIFEANRPKTDEKFHEALAKFYAKTADEDSQKPTDTAGLMKYVQEHFAQTVLRPDTTKITLGKPFTEVSGTVLHLAADKILGVSRGTHPVDDRDSLAFKEVVSAEDFLPEKIERSAKTIRSRIRKVVDFRKKVNEIIPSGDGSPFNRPIHDFFANGSLAERSDQTNPLQMLSAHRKTTLMSADLGGIKSDNQLTEAMQVINPSHFGFIDVMKTPESERTGITVNLSLQARKNGKDLEIPAYNLQSGEMEYVKAVDFHESSAVLPDQVRWRGGKPVAINSVVKMKLPGGSIEKGSFKDAKYVMPSSKGMFDFTSNMIPFLPCDQGNRVSMADKQMEQAIGLKHREAPLVQAKTEAAATFEKTLGQFSSHSSPVSGKVTAIKADEIVVDDGKKKHVVQLYDNFPLNDPKGMMHSEPVVKVGDSVHAGQLLADTNYTRNGHLAIGTNLRVGYVPYKGYNFEDGIVISETAAKKLTSEHLHKMSLELDPELDKIDKARFRTIAQTRVSNMSKDELNAIDDDGVVRVGTKVKPGQVLVAATGKNLTPRSQDEIASGYGGKAYKAFKDKSLVWDHDHVGTVVKVTKDPNGKGAKVFVRTDEPMVIGDKISARHGNKGIVTMILPDHEMPFTKDEKGEKRHLEVILNPTGVPCYDEETEFHTTRGWVLGRDLREDDFFGTLNQQTFEYEFQKPEEVYKIPYKGRMYKIENQQIDLVVTPHHKQFTARRTTAVYGTVDIDDPVHRACFSLQPAEEIVGEPRRYLKAARWKGEDPRLIHVPAGTKEKTGQPAFSLNFYSMDWAEFMGWFLSEGSTYENNNYGYVTEISQMKEANPEKHLRIRELLTKMGLKFGEYDNGFRIFHKGLYEYLSPLGGSSEKYIPRSVLDLPPTHLKLLLDCYLAGDGHEEWDEETGHYGSVRFHTTSKMLADGFQEVAIKLGMAANIKEDKRGAEKYRSGKCYLVSVSGSRYAPWVNWSETTKINQKEEWVHYDGTVYCATVPNGILMVRRNGKHVFSGNTRINVGQSLETAAGKIAEKNGKPYVVDNFSENHDYLAQVQKDLKTHGLSDLEPLYDPDDSRRPLGDVLVGSQYLMKLKHQVEKKLTVRGGGTDSNNRPLSYDLDGQPTKGGERGGQGFGSLEVYSLLGHNARHNLREMATYKSDKQSEDFWRLIQEGREPPPPSIPFSYKKFEALLKGLGVNVTKNGTNLQLQPFTDKQILEAAGGHRGEIKSPNLALHAKNLKEEKNGLFDPQATGGMNGTKWSYLKLSEPLPNPVFVGSNNLPGPIPILLGISIDQVESVMHGTLPLNGKTGGSAIKEALRKIDVDQELTDIRAKLPTLRKAELDRANKKLKMLVALKETGLRAEEAYVLHHIPILPPQFRPVTITPKGDIQVGSLNGLYKNVGILNQKLREVDPKVFTETHRAPVRAQLYDALKALQSIGGSVGYDTDSPGGKRKLKGILDTIGGGEGEQPKQAYFQSKLVKRRQGLSIRSTIIPEPKLGIDEVGLPRHAAIELYKPFVVAELGKVGISTLDAQLEIKKRTQIAMDALSRVVEDRPLLLKRDPALHKFSVMAFRPVLIDGKAIQIHPLVTGGFNADFDGDQTLGSVLLAFSTGLVEFLQSLTNEASRAKVQVGAEWTAPEWWEQRRVSRDMAARIKEAVGYVQNGELFICNLEDFPHLDEKVTKGHIDFHSVPPGLLVIAYDEEVNHLRLAPVSHWSLHRARQVEIVTLASGHQLVTDDDERAVYGLDQDLRPVRRRPKDAIGLFVPTSHSLEFIEHKHLVQSIPIRGNDERMRDSVELDATLGHLLGTLVGDGWVVYSGGEQKGQVALAAAESSIAAQFASDLLSVFHDVPTISEYERIGGDFGDDVESRKYVVSSVAFSEFIRPLIGKTAEKKHMPPFFLSAPPIFRRGLLAGLIDTDGSISISNGKKKPQWMISFSSSSIRLAQEMVYLSKSLGVRATITPSKTPKGEPHWAVTFSTVDFHKLDGLPIADVHKKDLFEQFFIGPRPEVKNSYSQIDIIPTPKTVAREIRDAIGTSLGRSIYVVLSNAMSRGYISRYTAKEILEKRPDLMSRGTLSTWSVIVHDDPVWWSPVESYEVTNQVEDGYDLTVPGYENFMSVDGVILSNTMAGTIPVSREAIEESKKMFPSRNLFSSTTGGVMYKPNQEMMLGLHLLSKWGKATNKSFKDVKALHDAVDKGTIHPTDVVKVEQIGSRETTYGRVLMESRLPRGFALRQEILHNPEYVVTKGKMGEITDQLARNHVKEFDSSINSLKDIGNKWAFKFGFSFGLDDLKPIPQRDVIVEAAHQKADVVRSSTKDKALLEKKLVEVYQDATAKLDAAAKEHHKKTGNRLMTMVFSGARGSTDQLRQMIAAPMLMQDGTNRILPTPVTRSYAEGLDIGDYWLSQHGARKGTLQRAQGTSDPGALTKDILNTTMSTLVTSTDCGTNQGILMDLHHRDIVDRFTAAPYKTRSGTIAVGTLVTPEVLSELKNAKIGDAILVRSPLKCQHGSGICAKCFGLNENGKLHEVGVNIGVLAGQSMGEPAVQMAMDAFHAGGVASSERGVKSVDRFTRLRQLLGMPHKLRDSAVLAKTTGKVTAVTKDPAGGHDVFIGDERHYLQKNLTPKVSTGDSVERGGVLSDGSINPVELLPLTNIHTVQNYITSQFHSPSAKDKDKGEQAPGLYEKEGVRRRNIEVVVRGLTNLTKVVDPGSSEWQHGDVLPTSSVEEHNRGLPKGKAAVRHEPMLVGVTQIPVVGSKDWMGRLNYQRLQGTIMQGAAQGWKSDIHGDHPIPGLARGSEFGQPPTGSKKHVY